MSSARSRRPLVLLILASSLFDGDGLRQGSPPGSFLAAAPPLARAGNHLTSPDVASDDGWNGIKQHLRDIAFGSSIKGAIDSIGVPGIMLAIIVSVSGVIAVCFMLQSLERQRRSPAKPEKEKPETEARRMCSPRDACLGLGATSLICLVGLFFLLTGFLGGSFLKDCIEHFDVAFLGTHVRLDSLDIFPFSGTVSATGLTLYDPPGWAGKYLLHVDSISVAVSMTSFVFSLGQRIDVSSLLVSGVNVIFKKSWKSSNIEDFLDHLKELYGAVGAKHVSNSSMAVSLHKVDISNVTARVELPGGAGVSIDVPDVVDNNFEKTTNSTSATADFIIDFLLDAVLRNVMSKG